MKQAISDISNLLKNDLRLQSDSDSSIQVKTFCKFEDPLIPDFPAVSLMRKSKEKQIKTMPLGYIESYKIDIICHVQELESSDGSMKGFDNLDLLTGIIENIIMENPKITPEGKYLDSEISDTIYEAYPENNYINFRAIISVVLKRKVIHSK